MRPGISWAVEVLDLACVAVEMVAAEANTLDVDDDAVTAWYAMRRMIAVAMSNASPLQREEDA